MKNAMRRDANVVGLQAVRENFVSNPKQFMDESVLLVEKVPEVATGSPPFGI